MEYYAAKKRDENLPFATAWMDLEGVAKSLSHVRFFERVFAKWNKSDREKLILYDITYM